jgi:hypothetical protein
MTTQAIIKDNVIINIIQSEKIDKSMIPSPRDNGSYAAIGGTYDESSDSFIPQKPYASWVLSDSMQWEAPIQNPAELLDEGFYIRYDWNESAGNWMINNESFRNLRGAQYDSITDQLDQLYWDKKNGTSTWEEGVDAVKAAYPKPTE